MRRIVCLLVLMACTGLGMAQTTGKTKTSPTENVTPYLLPRNALSLGFGFLDTTGDPGFSAIHAYGGYRHRGLELAAEFNAGGTTVKVPDLKVKEREQDYMFGPRFYFSRALSNPRFVPFAHALFGFSHLSADVTNGPSSSDNAYSWAFGGGVEYHFSRAWGIRGRGEVFRTHFLDDSQTHARWGMGVLYIIGE